MAKKKKEIKMVRRKICRAGVLEGYWKGKYIAVIPKYHPDVNPADYVVEEMDFPSDMILPRLIEVESMSLSEIKEICECNDLPFLWITGIDPNDEKAISVIGSDPLKKAIEHLIAFGSSGTTSSQYRKIYQELTASGVINAEDTIDAYLDNQRVIANQALKFSTCRKYSEKIYDVLQSLDKFIASPSSVRQQNKHREKLWTKFRQALSQQEMEQFFLALQQINPLHELAAKLLWHLNFELFGGSEQRVSVTLESLLRLRPENLYPKNYWVSLTARGVCNHIFHSPYATF